MTDLSDDAYAPGLSEREQRQRASNLSESPARGSLSGGGDARSLSEAEEGYGRADFGDSGAAPGPNIDMQSVPPGQRARPGARVQLRAARGGQGRARQRHRHAALCPQVLSTRASAPIPTRPE